jgi:hypothetical protein
MHIRIKTAEEFHSSHVTIEIRADDQAEVEAISERLSDHGPDSGRARAQELAAQVDRLEVKLAESRELVEFNNRAIDAHQADFARVHALFQGAARQLGEIQKIADREGVSDALDLGTDWSSLAHALRDIRRVLSSPPSSQA